MPPVWSHERQTLKPAAAWAAARCLDVLPFASRMASAFTPSRRNCARCFPDRTMLSVTFPSALICWSTMSYPADARRPAVAASTVAEYMSSPPAGWSFAVAGAIADTLRTTPKTSAYRRRMGPFLHPAPRSQGRPMWHRRTREGNLNVAPPQRVSRLGRGRAGPSSYAVGRPPYRAFGDSRIERWRGVRSGQRSRS